MKYPKFTLDKHIENYITEFDFKSFQENFYSKFSMGLGKEIRKIMTQDESSKGLKILNHFKFFNFYDYLFKEEENLNLTEMLILVENTWEKASVQSEKLDLLYKVTKFRRLIDKKFPDFHFN